MKARRTIPIIVGIVLLLMGTVFAFQGAGMAGTGGLMDNNSTWIYIGGAIAVLGVLLVVLGAIPRREMNPAPAPVPTS